MYEGRLMQKRKIGISVKTKRYIRQHGSCVKQDPKGPLNEIQKAHEGPYLSIQGPITPRWLYLCLCIDNIRRQITEEKPLY